MEIFRLLFPLLNTDEIESVFNPKTKNGYYYSIYKFKHFPNQIIETKSYTFLNGDDYNAHIPFKKLFHLGSGERYNTISKKFNNIISGFVMLLCELFSRLIQIVILHFKARRKILKSKKIWKDNNIYDLLKVEEFTIENITYIKSQNWQIKKYKDDKGNFIKTEQYEKDNTLTREVIFTYNNENQIIGRQIKKIKENKEIISTIKFLDNFIVNEKILIRQDEKDAIEYELFIAYYNGNTLNDMENFHSITCKKNNEYEFIITKSTAKIF